MNVYCGDCRYWKVAKTRISYWPQCFTPSNVEIVHTPAARYKSPIVLLETKNENNDCPDFKPSFWFQVKTLFRGK